MICHVLKKIEPELESQLSFEGPDKETLKLGCKIEKKHVPSSLKAPYRVDQDPLGIYWDMPSRGTNAWAEFTIYFDSNGNGRFLFKSYNLEKNKPTIPILIMEACRATMISKKIMKIKTG